MTTDIELVRFGLRDAVKSLKSRGMPEIPLSGQLIRPALAYSAAGRVVTPEFWNGALAIQYAHEASLVHDDIIDEAKTRRGQPTAVESHGVARALVTGDHLLTTAYRLAAETKSIEFVSLFSRSVERTVAGEIEQGKSLGKTLTFAQYKAIAEAKSGELLAASLALSAALNNVDRAPHRAALGRHLGLLYQMLDDLLDYCPSADTGKPALGDFRQRRWTWPLLELGQFSFEEHHDDVRRRMCERRDKVSVLERCLVRIEAEADILSSSLASEFNDVDAGQSLIRSWVARAREAVTRETDASAPPPVRLTASAHLVGTIGLTDDVMTHLSRNSRSFRFASRFLPADERNRVARVYSFCRITDDIADELPRDVAEPLLDEWMVLARAAYDGNETGISFLDLVMSEMRHHGVPFKYARDLGEGMRMDLRGERYETLSELETYTYRVASVVGMWLTELAGVHDWRPLHHARALGHAMQLTNILRDVGEDARGGRLYLPASRLRAHGVTADEIMDAAHGRGAVSTGYSSLVEEMLGLAEADYSYALRGVRDLPPAYQRTFSVAAHVYRGIHSEIRRNRYDNLTQRAVTSMPRKITLAVQALWRLEVDPVPTLHPA